MAPPSDLFTTLLFGSIAGLLLVASLIITVLLSQRRAREAELQRITAVRESEKLFRALVENSTDGIIMLDESGTIGYCGPSTNRLLGYTPDELTGKNAFELIYEKDRERTRRILGAMIAQPGSTATAEFRLVKKNGALAWFEGVGTNLLADPQIRAIVANYREITERKVAEEALRDSEEKYRTFFNEDLSGIFISSPDGKLIDCNPRFAHILGFLSVQDALSANAYALYDKRSQRDAYLELLRQRKHLEDYEEVLVRIDGKKINVVANIIGDFDQRGNLRRIRGYLFDVSSRIEAEERYRALFEESQDVIFISSPGGRFVDVNPAAVELFGYTSEEDMLRIDIAKDLYWNPAERERFEKLIRRQGFVKDLEVELKRKDGQKIVALETTTAVRDPSGRIVAYRGIMRDITAQKKLEEQLRQAQKMESIGTLTGGIAHDFNNIMGIMLGHIAVLERNKNDEKRIKQSIEALNKAVHRGAGLVRQMLTFARKAEVQFESVDLNTAVEDIVKILKETFPKTIAISLDLGEKVPSIVADYNQIHQVLLNLCVNARDAMMGPGPSSEPSAAGTLTLRTSEVPGTTLREKYPEAVSERYVCISCGDTGCGMDQLTTGRIFEPFFTTKEKGKGTGLGLSVVYGVVKSHQGFIDVETAVGQGAVFHLYFPVPQKVLRPVQDKPKEVKEAKGGNETILVVEDEEMLLDLVHAILEEKGYRVLNAKDGLEAVELYRKNKGEISLVLSDMGLPKMGGWEAFRKMREMNPQVKVILASGYLDPNVRSEMLKAGAKDFVQKPYDVNQILHRIREVIDTSISSFS